MNNKLTIKNLFVSVEGKQIIKNLSYEFEPGKVYALIGPNGNGKSTLISSIMGDPDYEINSGEIYYKGELINEMEVDERARLGIYLGMQYPPEINGVKGIDLIISSLKARNVKSGGEMSIFIDAEEAAKKLRLDPEMLERDVNVGFSGGEKKKSELMQMILSKPTLVLLDEVDSGLDVDSIEAIAKQLKEMKNSDTCFIIISHYKKLYNIIGVDETIVIKDGTIDQTGDQSLLNKILEEGFDGN